MAKPFGVVAHVLEGVLAIGNCAGPQVVAAQFVYGSRERECAVVVIEVAVYVSPSLIGVGIDVILLPVLG